MKEYKLTKWWLHLYLNATSDPKQYLTNTQKLLQNAAHASRTEHSR